MGYKNFEYMSQQVWLTGDLEEKKKILINMVEKFSFKSKQQEFLNSITSFNNQQCDQLAANLTLNEKMKVI